MANTQYIANQSDLDKLSVLISSLKEEDFIAFDTEFTRTKTFYPELDLIQLSIKQNAYIIDPLSKINLIDFLLAFNFTKATVLMFSLREDLEVLANLCEQLGIKKSFPKKLIDVQLMLSFAGVSYTQGLQSALNEHLNIDIQKDQTTSDWQVRPLTQDQITYAIEDVIYLESLYKAVFKLFKDNDIRFEYFKAEMINVANKALVEISNDECYQLVSGAGSLNKKQLYILKTLCSLRSKFSKEHNEALNRVITTKALCNICRLKKHNNRTLAECGMKYGAIRSYGSMIIQWFDEAYNEINNDKSLLDKLILPYDAFANNREYIKKINSLKHILTSKAKDLGICKELLSNRTLVNDYFFKNFYKQTPIIEQSWYKEAIGSFEL